MKIRRIRQYSLIVIWAITILYIIAIIFYTLLSVLPTNSIGYVQWNIDSDIYYCETVLIPTITKFYAQYGKYPGHLDDLIAFRMISSITPSKTGHWIYNIRPYADEVEIGVSADGSEYPKTYIILSPAGYTGWHEDN